MQTHDSPLMRPTPAPFDTMSMASTFSVFLEPGDMFNVEVTVPADLPETGPVFFDVKVTNTITGASWVIMRRYREWHTFRQRLRRAGIDDGTIPDLSALSRVRSIVGPLYIYGRANASLTSLAGLENLQVRA